MVHRERYKRLVSRFLSAWSKLFLLFGNINLKVEGNIPQGKGILILANHQSYLDIFALLATLTQPYSFVVKRSLRYTFPLNLWIKELDCVTFLRRATRAEVINRRKVVERLKNGDNFIIFPEGQRTKTGTIGEIKKGTLRIAQLSGATVIPTTIIGGYNLLPRGRIFIKPGEIMLTFGKSIRHRNGSRTASTGYSEFDKEFKSLELTEQQ